MCTFENSLTSIFCNVLKIEVSIFPDPLFSTFYISNCILAKNALQQEWGNFPFANWNGIFEDFRYSLYNWQKYIFCPIWNLLCENGNLKRNFSKKVLYNPPMGCFPFANYHFQMGVTIMGFVEHSGHSPLGFQSI